MNYLEMQVMFQDIVEGATKHLPKKEMPVTDIIFQYLTESQLKFFNERYLTGSFSERSAFLKAHKQELLPLISEKTYSPVSSIANTISLSWDNNTEFVEGFGWLTATLMGNSVNPISSELLPVEGNVSRYITNHVNTPIILQPVIELNRDGKAKVYHDIYTSFQKIVITLLNTPSPIGVSNDCLIVEKFHEGIVRNAAQQFLADVYGLAIQASKKEEK
jgi:hypothetical protein